MFNHSTLHQNVGWRRDVDNQMITYMALRDIADGEELCISYGEGRLWFRDAEMEEMKRWEEGDRAHRDVLELEASGLSELLVDEQ